MSYPSEIAMTTLATLKPWLDTPPTGGVSSVVPSTGGLGSGYTSTPSVAVTDAPGGAGTGATVTAVVVGQQVTSYIVTAKGQNYTSPQVVVSGGGGTGASATAAIGADVYLTRLIQAASALLAQLCNADMLFDSGSNITEKRNGHGKDRIALYVPPIGSIVSVTIGTLALVASDGVSAGWLFDKDYLYLIGHRFDVGVQNVTVVYRGGLVAGSVAQVMLEQACLSLCALWWKRRPFAAQVSISESQVGVLTFSQKDIPPETWTIVKQLRRVVPPER